MGIITAICICSMIAIRTKGANTCANALEADKSYSNIIHGHLLMMIMMTMVMMITASPKTSQRILEVVVLISMNRFMEIGV